MLKHGGRIGVKSSGVPGEGCVFFVEMGVQICDDIANGAEDFAQTHNPLTYLAYNSSSEISDHTDKHETQQGSPSTTTSHLLSHVSPVLEGAQARRKRRALVVDDSRLNVKMLTRSVRKLFDVVSEVKVAEVWCGDRVHALPLAICAMLPLSVFLLYPSNMNVGF